MERTPIAMSVVLAAAIWAAAPAASQEAQFEHVHLTVSDFRGAATWYVTNMGGKLEGTYVSFGDFNVRFHPEKDTEIMSSAGSVIDHIAFSFADLDAKMRDLAASGVRILEPLHEQPDGLESALIEDPWGTRVELVEDPELLGFHHVCLRGPEPAKILDWLVQHLGGDRTRYRGRLDAVRYEQAWVVAEDSGGGPVAAVGAHLRNQNAEWRALDHLGFVVEDLAATERAMRESGVRFTLDPVPFRTARLAGVEGPYGLVVELVDLDP
jgi:catechol 2,3-dioxygenase-like lactoylglutathione lyase family enzyme